MAFGLVSQEVPGATQKTGSGLIARSIRFHRVSTMRYHRQPLAFQPFIDAGGTNIAMFVLPQALGKAPAMCFLPEAFHSESACAPPTIGYPVPYGSDSQSQTLSKQCISAITASIGNDGSLFWKMNDVGVIWVTRPRNFLHPLFQGVANRVQARHKKVFSPSKSSTCVPIRVMIRILRTAYDDRLPAHHTEKWKIPMAPCKTEQHTLPFLPLSP